MARPGAPRLVVILVIDQFRADYVDMYGHQWTGGLRRLYDRGAVFPLAMYPYSGSVTCPGHVTIGTGNLPYAHGMFANTIYDKTLRRGVGCMTDPTATSVPFGGATGTERHSGRNVKTPAFADELRLQARRPPNIVSVALKPRSAIGLGGHGGPNTVVVWEEDNGTWATSDAYTKTPWPDVDEYVRAHPMAAAYGQSWSRLKPESTYLHEDDGAGENSPGTWTRTFPHKLESKTGKPDIEFVTAWERSPWNDEFVAGLALHLLASRKLGTQPGTDMLALSLTSLDSIGHEFGPRSHEVQDALMRADVLVGRLLDGARPASRPRQLRRRLLGGPRRRLRARAGRGTRHGRRPHRLQRDRHGGRNDDHAVSRRRTPLRHLHRTADLVDARDARPVAGPDRRDRGRSQRVEGRCAASSACCSPTS